MLVSKLKADAEGVPTILNSKVPFVPEGAPSELVKPFKVIFLLSVDNVYVPVNLRPSNSVKEAAVELVKSYLN